MPEKNGTERSIELCQEQHRIMPKTKTKTAQNYAQKHRIMPEKNGTEKKIKSVEARAARARA